MLKVVWMELIARNFFFPEVGGDVTDWWDIQLEMGKDG